MYQLDATNKSFQFKFAEADTTHSMWAAAYSEITVSTSAVVSIASADGASNGTTVVPVIPSPASGNSIKMKHFSLYNADSVTHTFEWQIVDGATTRTVFQQIVPIGGNIICDENGDWHIFDSTGTLSATSLPTPNTLVLRDSNANFQTNAVEQAVATTVSSAVTAILTAASAPQQQFTGTHTQGVKLPDATTLSNGAVFRIINRSTGILGVADGSGASIGASLNTGSDATFTLINNSTVAGIWDATIPTFFPVNNSAVLRDLNANIWINNISQGFTSTTTAAGTTALTNASSSLQQFTGTTTQTVVLPDIGTLHPYQVFRVMNRSTGAVTVKNFTPTTLQVVPPGTDGIFTTTDNLSQTDWDVILYSGGSGNPKMCNYQYQYTASSGSVSPTSSPFNIPINTLVSDLNSLVSVNLSTGEITWNVTGTFEIDVTMFYEAAGVGALNVAVSLYTGGGSVIETSGPSGVAGGFNGIIRLQTVRSVTVGDTWYIAFIGSSTSGYIGTSGTGGWYPSTNAPGLIFEATQLA